MSTEQLAQLIDKLPPEKRELVERLIEALGSERSAGPKDDGDEKGIMKWAGRFHLGGPIGSLTAEELHGDD